MAHSNGSPALYRAGEGAPLLLLHGATGTWQHWNPVLPGLSERYEVIAPTLAGHYGGPPLPGGVRTLADIADALERQLDELGIGAVDIAGNSLGGALGIVLATRGRARSVVALSPACGWDPGDPLSEHVARFFEKTVQRARLALPLAPLAFRAAATRRNALRHIARHGERTTPAEAVHILRAAARFTHLSDLTRALRTSEDALPQHLDKITVPVLLAWAERDWVLPHASAATRYRREVPGAEFRLLPGTGHVPMWDAPELVMSTVDDWITHAEPLPEERL
ncbi:alpha/beta fold hydrolase [Lentzea sp. NPDC051213]|uniref:alpha/beta fold hydrolase n=1 Tax=Lentzea sp. NPDC051213 TaxID=3364126 RepID=UPI00378FD685